MKKKLFSDQIVTAIDVGTTKVCTIIARVLGPDGIEVLGMGTVPSEGLEKGTVVDVGQAVISIKNSLQEAELVAGCAVESAYVGISGAHIQAQTSEGMVPLKHGEVRPADIMQVLASARAVSVPKGQHILHVLPHYFIIDGHQKVRDPLGLCGIRLEVKVHIITGALALVNNLIKCCTLAGVEVKDIILEQLASGYAVLTSDERKLGVALIDIGGGTSDLALYHRSAVIYTYVLPVAGTNFTTDLAIGLQTTLAEAERIKIKYGCAVHEALEQDELIELVSADGITKKITTPKKVSIILEARAQELLELISRQLYDTSLHLPLPTGLVLTGGGALLQGIETLAQRAFSMPVRIGKPTGITSIGMALTHPSYATGYGLLLYALQKRDTANATLSGPAIMRIVARMRSWVVDLF